MGKIDNFSINFNKKSQIFIPGEVISGKVYLKIAERIRVKNVYDIIR